MSLAAWITSNWPALVRGDKIEVPPWLPRPPESGFREVEIAMPAGQVRDWAVRVSDGSRVHVHEYPDGRLVAHRDRYDPDRGLGSTISHLWSETPWGAVAILALLVGYANRASG